MAEFETKYVPAEVDAIAPDGAEIRLLPVLDAASAVHCTLPPGRTSLAVTHRTVEEIWFFTGGQGQVWRRQGKREQVVDVRPGMSLTIPLGTHFQFRNTGHAPLEFLIVTLPPWPGDDEAVRVDDHWPTDD